MKVRAGSFVACLVAIAATVASDAHGADYPTHPIKLVVNYAAGGPTDLLARLFGDFLGKDLKQPVIIENKGGAQGAIGAEEVARSDPDGYTLLFTTGSVIVTNPLLYKKLSYDPVRDFKMLAIVCDSPLVMEVHPSVPARTVAELVAYARQNPGKVSFGSGGVGATVHLAGEMFKQVAGIQMTHVPYKGTGPALSDLLAGHIQLMFDSVSMVLPQVKAGSLRALGVTTEQRSPDLPDVPTIAESGYPDYRVSLWYGFAVPAKLPDDVTARISAGLDRAMNDDAFRAQLEKLGFPVERPRSAAAIKQFIDADRARWSAVIKAQSLSLD
jgi:tripartite-type tricarboxylate transporter receptor subunit TctC